MIRVVRTIAGAALLASLPAAALAQGGPPPQALPPPVIFPPPGDHSDGAAYVRNCAICHAPGGAGALQLSRRVPPGQEILANRTDLTPEIVETVVRNGIGSMPPLPRGGVSDVELREIAAYLSRSKKAKR